jgi:hypothetical protein
MNMDAGTNTINERFVTASNLASCEAPMDMEAYEQPLVIEAELTWTCDPILPNARAYVSIKYPRVIERKRRFCELVVARARGPPGQSLFFPVGVSKHIGMPIEVIS